MIIYGSTRALVKKDLTTMTAANVEPTISDEGLERLLNLAQRQDGTGKYPADVGWSPTFDIDAAAAEGCVWKAAASMHQVYFTSPSLGQYNQQQMYNHFMKQAEMYRARISYSVPLRIRSASRGRSGGAIP